MASGQVTISHPTSAFSPIVLECFNGDGYRRVNPGEIVTAERTPFDTMTLESSPNKYIWTFGIDLTQAEAMYLAFVINWQNKTFNDGADGTLLLTDEVLHALPEPGVNTHRPHLTGSTVTIPPLNWFYGFATFRVKLQMPSDALLSILGQDTATLKPRLRVIFSAEEI